MPEYRVAITLTRGLNDSEVNQLLTRKGSSISSYEMHGTDVVMVALHSPNSLTAVETAEIQVQRSTGVEIGSSQLIP